MYRLLFRLLLVRLDPEQAHRLGMRLVRLAGAPLVHGALRRTLGRPPRETVAGPWGRPVPGVLGLAAGLDKDAEAVLGLDALGFAFVEVGTVTAHPQPGNDRPRLWRLVERRALRNRMGFNNAGADAAGRRLQRLRGSARGRRVVVGANIGKSKITPLDRAVEDYAHSARCVARWVDYLVVNVSSPNTPGLRDLQAVTALRPILRAVQDTADDAAARHVPVLVKVAPDLAEEELDAVADLVTELDLAGVVAVNTTIAHDLGPGGLSGEPLRERARAVVGRLRTRLGPHRTIIGVGGIASVEDARAMRAAGADLLQAYTAFVYQGPAWPGRLNRGPVAARAH